MSSARRAPPLRRRAGTRCGLTWGLALVLGSTSAAAQEGVRPGTETRALQVTADTSHVTVGQPVAVRVRGRLAPGESLSARTVVPLGSPPEGMRILAQDSLVAGPDGSVGGGLRVAFFRPGRRAVPALAVLVEAAGSSGGQRLVSTPLPIEVARVLPPGEQTLRDIKDLVPLEAGGLPPWLLAAAVALAALTAWLLWRRLRRRHAGGVRAAAVAERRDPYEAALQALEEIEAAGWPERGEVPRHYAATADVLRRYLEDAEGVPALELTTTELAWSLPPALSDDGRRDATSATLGQADLVKFARARPGIEAARSFSRDARGLLEGWREASARAREAALAALVAASSAAGEQPARDGGAAEAAAQPSGEEAGAGQHSWAPPEADAWRRPPRAGEERKEDPGALR